MIRATSEEFSKHHKVLKASYLDTPLGSVFAISDEDAIYSLEFVDTAFFEHKAQKLQAKADATIISGITSPIRSIKSELKCYFEGTLRKFKTPLYLLGTTFQKLVWEELMRIPYGATRSYAEHANIIGKQTACRAVANANGANKIAIVIPCHRIINSNGQLGGYSGGIARKKWLIDHEKLGS